MDKHGRHTDATTAFNFTQGCFSVRLIAHSQHAIHKQAHTITHTHTHADVCRNTVRIK